MPRLSRMWNGPSDATRGTVDALPDTLSMFAVLKRFGGVRRSQVSHCSGLEVWTVHGTKNATHVCKFVYRTVTPSSLKLLSQNWFFFQTAVLRRRQANSSNLYSDGACDGFRHLRTTRSSIYSQEAPWSRLRLYWESNYEPPDCHGEVVQGTAGIRKYTTQRDWSLTGAYHLRTPAGYRCACAQVRVILYC